MLIVSSLGLVFENVLSFVVMLANDGSMTDFAPDVYFAITPQNDALLVGESHHRVIVAHLFDCLFVLPEDAIDL